MRAARGVANLTWSCCFYLISSAGMSIFNKLAIAALPLPITLVMLQMVFTVGQVAAHCTEGPIGSSPGRGAVGWHDACKLAADTYWLSK